LKNSQNYLANIQTLPSLEVVEIALAEKSLSHFVQQAWKIVEPKKQLVWGWHLGAICNHLEAVSSGLIKYLLINIPPRHTKSLIVSVFWPAWTWINYPEKRWLFSAYAETLSTRDNVKCRRLILSDWYQRRWSNKFSFVGDQNQKTRFENSATGYRVSTSVRGVGTGEGGDFIVCDDPHNVKESESDVTRLSTLQWWDESMQSRVDNPDKGAFVIIQQRVHEDDLSGHVIEQGGYDHLCLPAEYEGENRCNTSLDFIDPRVIEGELLCADRFGAKALEMYKMRLGSYAYSAQFQQRPSPRGGGMFQVENFVIVRGFHAGSIAASVRYWDKAGTEGGGAFSSGVKMHRLRSGRFVVEDVRRGHWSSSKREAIIKQTAEMDGKKVSVWVEQEPGSSGKESAENTIRNLAGFVIKADRVTGSKEVRAEPYAVQVENKNVDLMVGDWNKEFLNQHEYAPVGKYKDDWDAAAGALNKLAFVNIAGVWGSKK